MKKMTLEDIQELIKFVAKSGGTEVDLEFEGIKISIKSPPKKRRGEKEEKCGKIKKDTKTKKNRGNSATEPMDIFLSTQIDTNSGHAQS